MNRYTIEQLSVGMTESFTYTVTDESMDLFRLLTGDVSPIHISDEAARARGHKGRVVYGMLGASLFSTLAGVHLPGETCLLHSVDVKFKKPIYIGDTLTIQGKVEEVNDTFGTLLIKGTITNQDGVRVTLGTIRASVHLPNQA